MLIEKESSPKSKNENIEPIVSDDQPTILKSLKKTGQPSKNLQLF